VKVEVGIGVGKKLHDKRNDLRDKVVKREVDRAMKQRR
jgi:SsrA-binding protein